MNLLDTAFPSYLAKQAEIDAAWDLCEKRLAGLPSPLDALATRFLRAIAEGTTSHRSYFSGPLAPPLLYMPLWLADRLASEGALPARAEASIVPILAATMQGYFYVRIQDDLLDDPARADPELLLLGNACFAGMALAYTEALGPRAPAFFQAFDRAFAAFSRLTLAELRVVRGDAPYAEALFEEHAGKVAFARVPLLAVAALADALHLEAAITTLVDRLGVTYGLANDVLGWPRDLRAGHRTHLLAQAHLSRADLDHLATLTDEHARGEAHEALAERLRVTLYEGMLLHRTIERAIAEQARAAEDARELGLRGFEVYTADRLAWLGALDREILAMSMKRALGARSR
ncbi:hypothetical protein [Polyangium sp. 15x6]|uniref:hypothetical protein n=1 Tax=Polyangium sp. 15x6 TaxID=3042687 RepID=UPI00249A23E7|nr:hypothetical protein [Polyangium sp. 15x6]MDI3288382.1 hypothetical protein [Polyangium sp. 15x6]